MTAYNYFIEKILLTLLTLLTQQVNLSHSHMK